MAIKLKPIKAQVMVINGSVTGAGIAVARAAAKAGARVMLIGEDAGIGEAARAINNAGGRADYDVAATGDRAALATAVASATKRFGRIDSWINDVDEAGVVAGCAVAIPLIERGVVITIADDGASGRAIAAEVASVRATRRSHGDVPICLVVLPGGVAAPSELVVEAVLACAVRPRNTIVVGEDEDRSVVARIAAHPRMAVAVGLGGLALAAGTLAALRRRRSA